MSSSLYSTFKSYISSLYLKDTPTPPPPSFGSSSNLSPAEYKSAKEAFVSNLHGTTIQEIILVTLPLPIALWIFAEIKALRQVHVKPRPNLWLSFAYESALLIIPQILAQTFPNFILIMLAGLLLAAAVSRALVTTTRRRDPTMKDTWRHDKAIRLTASSMRNYLTNYRAGIMLTATIAILAVDFPIFPRRFAKTEIFGTGLMDLGVGCFIFSSGLCSRSGRMYHRRLSRADEPDTLTEATASAAVAGAILSPRLMSMASSSQEGGRRESSWRRGLRSSMWRTFKRSLPLLCLGLGRLLINRKLDYQVHVSEYGVHWNFFLTLACIQLLATFLHLIFPHKALFPLSIILIVIYQMHLSLGDLTDFVIASPRDPRSFFSQNREGILGIVGFLCLYLIGEQIGTSLIWRMGGRGSGTKQTEIDARYSFICLIVLDIVLWGATLSSHFLIQPISRRLTNMSYVLWISAHNVLMVALLLGVDTFASNSATSQLMSAVNRNQLAFFLLANLLTGAINLTMETIYAPAGIAIAVLLSYIFSLLFLFLLLDRVFNISLKFW